MKKVFIGLDISKGTMNACHKSCHGDILHEGVYDDTPQGHKLLIHEIKAYLKSKKYSEIQVGMESTGGYERNWFRSLSNLSEDHESLNVYIINPKLIKGFVNEKLHKSTTDCSAARDIAEFLRQDRPFSRLSPSEMLLSGSINLYRMINNNVVRCSIIKNELQTLLSTTRPELGQFIRSQISEWVLVFLQKYPTVEHLKGVRPKTIAKIPGITLLRAEKIVQAAKESIAAYRDNLTGLAIENLATQILILTKQIKLLKDKLKEEVTEHSLIRRLCTIPGISEWTAIGLVVEIGDIRRFSRVEEVIAYAGLDPVYHQSGDGVSSSKISRHGKASIRRLLYMPAQSAVKHTPAIREFYEKFKAAGKSHRYALTACMGKLLRICYALWVSEKDFDLEYYKGKLQKQKGPTKVEPGKGQKVLSTWDESAPISRREAKRRKILQKKSPQEKARSKPHIGNTEGAIILKSTDKQPACTSSLKVRGEERACE